MGEEGGRGEEGAIGEGAWRCWTCPGSEAGSGEDAPCVPLRPAEQHVLEELERQAVLVYTPSRKVSGKRVVCYDDRYIVKLAYEQDGVIVSNDNYRDLQSENPEWKWFIEQRLLMFSFVNDRYVGPPGSGGAWGGGGDGQKAPQLARARGALRQPSSTISVALWFSSVSRPAFPTACDLSVPTATSG